MAQLADVVLPDSVPANHTFTAIKVQGVQGSPETTLAEWNDLSGGVYAGFSRMTLAVRRPTPKSKQGRVTVRVSVPVLEVLSNSTVSGIAPAPMKAYEVVAEATFILPERASALSKADALAYLKAALSTASVLSAVQSMVSPT